MSKNLQKKVGCTLEHYVLAQKIAWWKNIFVTCTKKTKTDSYKHIFVRPDLSFLHRSQKNIFSSRNFVC